MTMRIFGYWSSLDGKTYIFIERMKKNGELKGIRYFRRADGTEVEDKAAFKITQQELFSKYKKGLKE